MPMPFQSDVSTRSEHRPSPPIGVSRVESARVQLVQGLRWNPLALVLGLGLALEIVLMLVALVPQTVWASHGFPDGPIPRALSPEVAAAFYVLPAMIGLLCRRWQAAIVLATLPAWFDLGLFAVAAASRVGPFYLATDPHAVSTVGTLELFAVLGALGWLSRSVIRYALGRREQTTA